MQCAFCGTENRPEHKFCGMCGVKLERRVAERRVHPSGVSTKCPSCGHMNEAGLKFCGMCGTRVERRIQERRVAGSEEARAAAIANAQLPTPEAAGRVKSQRTSVAAPAADLPVPGARRGEPSIFHDESARASKVKDAPIKTAHINGSQVSGSHTGDAPIGRSQVVDSRAHSQVVHPQISGPSFLGLNSQSEGSGEYLLEDEPSRGGLRKLVLLVILAAIIGLVFVQWRSNIKANPKPAPAKAEPASSPGPQGNNQPPAPAGADQPGKDAPPATKDVNGDVSAKDVNAKEDDKSSTAAADEAKPEAANSGSSVVPKANASPTEAAANSESKKSVESDDSKPSPSAKATDDTHLPDHKPSAALLRAQQYLQGRGVPQNCEQGMLYLRAATEKNDPGAAIQMAALYSSGHCVKQDRVMAYRWFNSAHELEPANTWIQRNMDQLWAQMTSQERRLAGY
jgi:hypothetical protein